MPRPFLAFLLLVIAGASSAYSQSIDIVLHPDNLGCKAADVGTNPWIELHVIANLEGIETFQGAQFRITGMPSTWNETNVVWSLDTSTTLSFGNPLFPGVSTAAWDDISGSVVVWNHCRVGVGSQQRIGKIILLGAPTGEDVTLQVEPFQLNRQEPYCARMNLCDAPFYTAICVDAGSFTLNGIPKGDGETCSVLAVEESTWSTVKSFYQ